MFWAKQMVCNVNVPCFFQYCQLLLSNPHILPPLQKNKTQNENICDALRDLVPFVQCKKREKHSRRSVTFSQVAGFSLNI